MATDLKVVKQKLYERLKPSGWADKLKGFLLTNDFDDILEELYNQSIVGKRFTPVIKQLFRAFEECPYSELKVVMIGQDPYPQPNVADGIAFSCSNLGKIQPSLKFMYNDLENTVYPNGFTWDPDLSRWSNQGVLMLNTSLTTEIGKIGKHYDIWKPFMDYLLDILTDSNTGIIYVFMGRQAEDWARKIPETNYKLFTTHPASAAYRKDGSWDSNDMFNRVNQIIQGAEGTQITW